MYVREKDGVKDDATWVVGSHGARNDRATEYTVSST
jgi:hypothetical protein